MGAIGSNPLIAKVLQSLGGGGASGPGGMVTGGGDGMGAGQMASELQGADPMFLLKSLQAIKQQLSQLFVQSSMRLPNVAGNVAKTMSQLDRAIKEAQQAAATQSVVRGPIGFSLAGGQGTQPPGGGGPPLGGF